MQTSGTAKAIEESIGEIAGIRGPRPVTADELALGIAALTRGYARSFETGEQIGRARAAARALRSARRLLRAVRPADRARDGRRRVARDGAAPRSRRAWSPLVVGDLDAIGADLDGARPRRSGRPPARRLLIAFGRIGHWSVGNRINRPPITRSPNHQISMKAVRFHQHGGPDVLRYEDAPDPELAPGEVLVRVRACALNHLDLWERRGLPRRAAFRCRTSPAATSPARSWRRPAPTSPIGRRVMLQPGISCGRCAACLSGRDNECPRYEVLGYRNHPGGYAEYVKVPVQNLIPIPDEIDFVQAAAFPLTFLTAWHMLMTRARLKRGEDVLVLAAGSGVGQAAIQIACPARRARVRDRRVRREARARAGAGRVRGDRPPQAGHRRGDQAADEPARRRCRHRTCRRGDVGEERPLAGPRRAAGHLRRDDRPERRARPRARCSPSSCRFWARTWAPRAS